MTRQCTFANVVERNLLRFSKPQSHDHKPNQLKSQELSLKLDKLLLFLGRGYFASKHILTFKNSVKGIYDSVLKFVNYLDKQAKLVWQNNKTQEFTESKIEDFTVIKIPFHLFEDTNWKDRFLSLKNILCKTDCYFTIEVDEFVDRNDKRKFYSQWSLDTKRLSFSSGKLRLILFQVTFSRLPQSCSRFVEATEK